MQDIDKQIFKRLTKLYLFALLAVAVLSFFGQLIIQLFMKEMLDDAHVINLAGRQRMLSQKLSKTATILCYPNIHNPKNSNYAHELDSINTLWANCHHGLMNGRLDQGKIYEVKNSPKINNLFLEIDPFFKIINTNAKILAKTTISKSTQQEALTKILLTEGVFLKLMNNIVYEYDVDSQLRVNKTRGIELLLFILLFTVLLFEGFFIFKPIANNIRNAIRKLSESENNLQTANSELKLSNQKLIDTRKELVQTTQEKYKLKLAEEKIRSSSLVEGQELERKRLSQELHDGIGQMLTGIKLQTEHLKSFPFTDQKQKKSHEELQQLVAETIEATRMVSFNLAPSVLSDFGLIAAIKILAEQNSKGGSIKIIVEDQLEKRLNENIEIGLYRIIQESINNAIKYAKPTEIKIKLSDAKQVQLTIIDNGIGFDTTEIKSANQTTGGSGIKNMQSRAQLLNGEFKIESQKKRGTKITVIIPKNNESKY